jgi:broad specificity phosphatase PhoE
VTHLILIRHGETDWNRARRIQGSTDIPLNDTGRAQARAAGERLRDSLDLDSPLRLVSSDLARAAETADIIGSVLGVVPAARYAGLRERGYGEAEGMSIDEFSERWGPWHAAEVPGAETRTQVRTRALDALATAWADAGAAEDEVTLVAVAHGALIREVLGAASDEQLPAVGERLANGSAQLFSREPDGSLRVLRYAAV